MESKTINNKIIESRCCDLTFGECINFMRVQHGMKDTDIAKRMGISTKRLGELCERLEDPNNKRRQDAVSADERRTAQLRKIVDELEVRGDHRYSYTSEPDVFDEKADPNELTYIRIDDDDFYDLTKQIIEKFELDLMYSQEKLGECLYIKQCTYNKKYVNKTDLKVSKYTTEQQYGILRNLLNLIGYRDMASMNYVYRNPAGFADCIYLLVNTWDSLQNTEKVKYRDIICSRSAYKETEHIIDLFDIYNVTDVQRDEIFRFLVRLMDRGIGNAKIGDGYVKAYAQCDCGKAISALNDYFAKRRNTATGDEELADFLSAEMLNSNCTDRSELTATLLYLISEISKSEYSNFLEKFINDSGMRQLTTVIIFEMCGYMRRRKKIWLTYKNGAFYRIKTADIFMHSTEVFETPLYNIANAVDDKEMLSETQEQIYNDAVKRFTKMNPAKQNVVLEHIKAFVPSAFTICDLSYMDCYRTIRSNKYDSAKRVIDKLIKSVHLNTTESYFPMIADCIKMSEKTEAVQNISDKGKTANKQKSNAKRYELYAKAYALVGINLTDTVEEKLKFTAEEWKVWALYECCIRSGQEELLEMVKKIEAKVIRDKQRDEEKQENAKQIRKKHSKEKNIE